MNKLLPYKLKIPGLISIICAAILTFFYFYYGFKISIPVFAVYSSFLETKIFSVFTTNFTEELILLLFIGGFSLIVFSKEKNEINYLKLVRIKALINTAIAIIVWWLFTLLFIFGNGFIAILVLNLIIPFIIYLAFFYRLKKRALKKARLQKLERTLTDFKTEVLSVTPDKTI
ncbi:MAG: hypothetical protein ACOCWD_06525 [Tangfeifania sp.]